MCIVQKYRQSSNVKVKGQGHRRQKTIGLKCLFSGVVLWGAVLVQHFSGIGRRGCGPLRRWGNQRMLSSFLMLFHFYIIFYRVTHMQRICYATHMHSAVYADTTCPSVRHKSCIV